MCAGHTAHRRMDTNRCVHNQWNQNHVIRSHLQWTFYYNIFGFLFLLMLSLPPPSLSMCTRIRCFRVNVCDSVVRETRNSSNIGVEKKTTDTSSIKDIEQHCVPWSLIYVRHILRVIALPLLSHSLSLLRARVDSILPFDSLFNILLYFVDFSVSFDALGQRCSGSSHTIPYRKDFCFFNT